MSLSSRLQPAKRVLLSGIAFACSLAALHAQTPVLKYERFLLPNGLTVLVHEDHRAPIVAVDIWYHVGSANEVPGKTGFAHLFEHLMFGGSEHVKGLFIPALQGAGATNLNGTTNKDRTNFFEVVPVNSLDYALFCESDRMGHFVLNKDTLDLQRGVVQNEKRQRGGEPYAVAHDITPTSTYPALHPYSHTVIGSMEDLNAASLDDVKSWFATYYGPSNATLTLAGDITPATARTLVEKYFGGIPSGPPLAHQDAWVAKMTGLHTEQAQDRVAAPRIIMTWNVPQFGTADADYLDILGDALAFGKNSRLYQHLVDDMQLATSVAAGLDRGEISSQFKVQVTAKPGADLKTIESTVEAELQTLMKEGPSASELERIKIRDETDNVLDMDEVIQQAETLAEGQVFTGDPNQYLATMQRIHSATPADITNAATHWLSDGEYRLEILPFFKATATEADVDRTKVPQIGKAQALHLPMFEHMTLSNGLQVVLAERHELPAVHLTMIMHAGFSSDAPTQSGTAHLTSALMLNGTDKYTEKQLSDELDRLGLDASAYASIDTSTVSVVGLASRLRPAMDILADVVEHPVFPAAEIDRQRNIQIARIEQEQTDGMAIAQRVLPSLLYGQNNPYDMPLSGTGTAASVQHLTREDLVHFHDQWYRPNNATLLVVGDTTPTQIKPMLEAAFGDWQRAALPPRTVPTVKGPASPGLYLIDRPGAQQSVVQAATVATPFSAPDEVAVQMWNRILGGTFAGRLNMNLRENKHWTYGASSHLIATAGQRPYTIGASVQTDKTKESVVEMEKEIRGMAGARPITADELSAAVDQSTKGLTGQIATSSALSSAMVNIFSYHLPEDFYTTYTAKAKALTPADLDTAAKTFFYPDRLVWLVVGDRARIEAGLKEVGLGPVHVLNVDGKSVQ